MARGENEEFQKRVGKLSKPLIKKNLSNMVEKRTEFKKDQIDLESLVDETLNFEENLDNLESRLEQDISTNPEEDPDALENELEKYESQWNDYMEKHDLTEEELT